MHSVPAAILLRLGCQAYGFQAYHVREVNAVLAFVQYDLSDVCQSSTRVCLLQCIHDLALSSILLFVTKELVSQNNN